MAIPDNVTITITSCGRLDLLARSIDSFRQFNTGGRYIISEDSADPAIVDLVRTSYPGMSVLSGPERVGLMRSIDRLYGAVDTPYILHLEDDFEFDGPVDAAAAIALLNARDDVANVSFISFETRLKEKWRLKSDPLSFADRQFCLMRPDAHPEFFGWSSGPGLMRTDLYKAYAPFGRMLHDQMSALIKRDGRREAFMLPGVAYHIGKGRNVVDPTIPSRPTSRPAKLLRALKKKLYYAKLRKNPF